MRYHSELHHRKSIRLKEYDYSHMEAYFVTICAHKRKMFLDYEPIRQIVQHWWNMLPKKFVKIKMDEFVIMPNHVHGIIMINDNMVGAIHELPLQRNQRRRMLIPKIIGFFKMNSSKRINIIRNKSGTPVWQRNYYEHIIRNENKLNRIREYIINNPLQWQFDRENPERVLVGANGRSPYYNQWGHLEETIYGKTR